MNRSARGFDGDIDREKAKNIVLCGYGRPNRVGVPRWNGIVKRIATDRAAHQADTNQEEK